MNKKNQQGVAIVLSVLLVSILISIVLVSSAIFIPKIRSASDVRRTTAALFAAESAIEWCIYVNIRGSTPLPVMSNGATFVNANTGVLPTEAECAVYPVTIIGTFEGVSRAFEISL